jgi:HD-GYP domain-containing protein (c-di-GMP phosphodiesterase class II)
MSEQVSDRHERDLPSSLTLQLEGVATSPTVSGALEAVRDFLGMEVAFTAEIVSDELVFRELRGDAHSFGFSEGQAAPLEQTYCERMLTGRLPSIITETQESSVARALPVTHAANIAAFVTVPITFANGELYGTLCAASHDPQPTLGERELPFLRVFARLIADQVERARLEDAKRAAEAEAAATETLLAAVEARDSYTGEHSAAVVDHAVAVARSLGLNDTEVTEVEQTARLHDVGKISTPDRVLSKPGALSEEEWQIMRRHPLDSERLIRRVPALSHLAPALRAEHERWDGAGYPDGLSGREIPLASRIVFVCDAYHAMTSDRPYRRALTPSDARRELVENKGTQFCPNCVEALLETL